MKKKISLDELTRKEKKRKHIRIALITILVLTLSLGVIGSCSVVHVMNVEQDRSTVTIQKKHSIVFFYRDDCPDCRKIFSQVLAGRDGGLPIQFVNTNNQTNKKKYLKKYNIKYVPTFIYLDKQGNEVDRYTGTNRTKIDEMLKRVGGLNH